MKTEQTKPLTTEYIEKYNSINDEAEKMAWEIGNRVGDIVDAICKVFNIKPPETIWFPGAGEGDIGMPDVAGVSSEVYYEYSENNLQMNTSDHCYGYSIPESYLYMTLDDIKADVQSQIDADEKCKQKQKERHAQKAKQKKEALESAKSKLTKEEIKALRI
jgi:hypothetical protein